MREIHSRRHRHLNRSPEPVEPVVEMSTHDRIQIRVEPDGLSAWVVVAVGPALTAAALRECLAEARDGGNR